MAPAIEHFMRMSTSGFAGNNCSVKAFLIHFVCISTKKMHSYACVRMLEIDFVFPQFSGGSSPTYHEVLAP